MGKLLFVTVEPFCRDMEAFNYFINGEKPRLVRQIIDQTLRFLEDNPY